MFCWFTYKTISSLDDTRVIMRTCFVVSDTFYNLYKA